MKWMLTIVAMVVTVATTTAGEIPKPEWRPGAYYGSYRVNRLSTDGKFITSISDYDVMVIDVNAKRCAFLEDFTLLKRGLASSNTPAKYASVSPSGNVMATLDTTGVVAWYQVGDSVPWMTRTLDSGQYVRIALVSDSVAMFTMRPSIKVRLTVNGPLQILPPDSIPPGFARLNDSVAFMTRDKISTYIDPRTRDTIMSVLGEHLGVDFNGYPVVAWKDSILVYDKFPFTNPHIIPGHVSSATKVIRNRFVATITDVVDLIDDSRLTRLVRPDDVLPDRTMLKFDVSKNHIMLSPRGESVDSIPVFDGPIVSITHDRRDSTLFFYTNSGWMNTYGTMGALGFITSKETYISSTGAIVSGIGGAYLIKDSLCAAYETWSQQRHYGYINLDRLRSKRSDLGVASFSFNGNPSGDIYPSYRFSERGDTLFLHKDVVRLYGCEPDTLPNETAGSCGFARSTTYYYCGNRRFDTKDCEVSDSLPFSVYSTYEHYAIGRVGDTLIMSTITDPSIRYASIPYVNMGLQVWADSGRTIRMSRNRHTVISMHIDGSVDSIRTPEAFQSSWSRWSWSHNGRILTTVSHDTIVSLDVLTGTLLREWYNIPWMTALNPGTEVHVLVSSLDARLVISLPAGCVTILPGLTLPVISSIKTESPLRPLQMHGTRIEGATPLSSVTVYSVLGSVVMQGHADDNGDWDIDDKGLMHGAYVVVYATSEGMRSGRILR